MIDHSSSAAVTTTIELLGKPYQIRCSEHEITVLQKAAQYLESTLKTLPGSKTTPLEKLAILAALHLASQLLGIEDKMQQHIELLNQRLDTLQAKLQDALTPREMDSAT